MAKDSYGSSGGSVWKKVFLVSGLGCAVLVLVGSVLMGLGVFRMATCCVEHGEKQEYLRESGYDFANAVHNGRWDQAHGMLSPSAKEQWSVGDFQQAFVPYEFDRRPPLTVGRISQNSVDGHTEWRMTVTFAGPRDSEAVDVRLVVHDDDIDVEAGSGALGIASWEISRLPRDLATTPQGESVLNFHRALKGQDFAAARTRVEMWADWRGDSVAEFAATVEPVANALQGSSREEVYGIYPEEPGRVRVKVRFVGGDGQTYFVDYYVQGFLHGIDGIGEIRLAHDDRWGDEEVQPLQGDDGGEVQPLEMPEEIDPIVD